MQTVSARVDRQYVNTRVTWIILLRDDVRFNVRISFSVGKKLFHVHNTVTIVSAIRVGFFNEIAHDVLVISVFLNVPRIE